MTSAVNDVSEVMFRESLVIDYKNYSVADLIESNDPFLIREVIFANKQSDVEASRLLIELTSNLSWDLIATPGDVLYIMHHFGVETVDILSNKSLNLVVNGIACFFPILWNQI